MQVMPTIQQYNSAYPDLHYEQPPSAANGYGWHGNGYGWQLQPEEWKTASIYPSLDDVPADVAPVEEVIVQQKVGKQNAIFGEKGSGFRTKQGGPQDFYKLREEHLQNGTLFEDPEFPPNNQSLFGSAYGDRRFTWKRPGEIVHNPKLFVEGFSRFDVQQGELGDCWLLAATANLTMYRRLFFQIVPDDQDFEENYAGIFHFRFWQYGNWIDVVIDDRLPTESGELIYLHSTEKNEFWSALLEKAYAKLHGSYEALKGGSTCEAMEDFTGGVTEMYELENPPPNLFKILVKAFERASLMGCSLEPDPSVFEASTPEGLVRGHAYSITKVIYLDIQTPNVSGKIPLLRLRNPWGNEVEWNGPWSDNSPEWNFISEDDKRDLGLVFDEDGEFWMSYKDFSTHFDRLEICNLNPDSLSDAEQRNKKKWEMSIYEGSWVRGVTAGGCRNFLDTFWNNPQYRITLTEVDEDDDDNKCTVIIALMQKNRRIIKQQTGAELLTIGFAIYYLPQPDRVPKPLNLNFFKYNASVARSPSFINLREVSCRFKLPPGTYCIVPSTYDPNEEGEFLLRVFSEHQNNMEYDGPSYNTRINEIHDRSQDEEEDEQSSDSNHRCGGGSPYSPPSPQTNFMPRFPYSPHSPHQSFPQSPFAFPSFSSGHDTHPSVPQQPNNPGGYPVYVQPAPYPGNAGPYPGYPNSPGQYPGNPSSYPSNPGQYPGNSAYPGYPNPSGYPGYNQPGYPNPHGAPSSPNPSANNRNRLQSELEPITNLFKKLFN